MHFYIERQIGLHSVKKNKAIKNTYHLLIDSMTTIVKLFAQKNTIPTMHYGFLRQTISKW